MELCKYCRRPYAVKFRELTGPWMLEPREIKGIEGDQGDNGTAGHGVIVLKTTALSLPCSRCTKKHILKIRKRNRRKVYVPNDRDKFILYDSTHIEDILPCHWSTFIAPMHLETLADCIGVTEDMVRECDNVGARCASQIIARFDAAWCSIRVFEQWRQLSAHQG